MMKEEDIPIPTQIIDLIGERNAADIFEKEGLPEDTDVEVWNPNIKYYFTLRKKTKKREAFHINLKAFNAYYHAKQLSESKNVSKKGSKVTEGESGYDSKDACSSNSARRMTLRSAEMPKPRAASPMTPSSQLDMFSTRSPAKVDSKPKIKVVDTRSLVNKESNKPKTRSSSSENESDSERVPPINVSPFVTTCKDGLVIPDSNNTESVVIKRAHSESENDSDTSNKNEPVPSSNTKNFDAAGSSSSDDESEKSSCPRVKEEQQNDSDISDSETSQSSVRRASVTSGNESSRSDSDQSEHEIIPATQELSQKSRKWSLSDISTQPGQSASPVKPPKKENTKFSQDSTIAPELETNEKDKTVQSSSPLKSQPITKRRDSTTSMSSESADDDVHPSNIPISPTAKSSSNTSESEDSSLEGSTNSKASLMSTKDRAMSTEKKESVENSSSDSDDSCTTGKSIQQNNTQRPLSLSNKSRKRKADSLSSSDDESDTEPKNKLRKTDETTENVPFNSTRNPEVDVKRFPGGDISSIPKTNEHEKPAKSSVLHPTHATNNRQNPTFALSNSQKNPGGQQSPRPGQLSILDFARPINSATKMSSQNNYEAVLQEYFDAGFSNSKEQFDFESDEGLWEEDLLDDNIEVYVVQCPKEIDPISFVGKKIDVSKEESFLELAVTGGRTVRHDIYCDLSNSDCGINVVVPSRIKKKFTLSTVPVNGRLTIVESVDVPQIEQFDSSSPPRIQFPEHLKPRNSFLESDSGSKGETFGAAHKTENKRNKDFGKLDDSNDGDDQVTSIKKKKKKKREGNPIEDATEYVHLSEETIKEDPLISTPEVPVEENYVKKKKKKKMHLIEEPNDVHVSEETVKEEPIISTPEVPVEENYVKKKKKKKKHQIEEPNDVHVSEETDKEERLTIPEVSVEENYVKKKKKKKHQIEESNDVHVSEEKIKKEPTSDPEVPIEEDFVKKKKKMKHPEPNDELNSDENASSKKKKKKKKIKEEYIEEE